MSTDTNEISFNNKKTAKYLLYIAIIVEICVALLAVFFGYSITYSGVQNLVGDQKGIIICIDDRCRRGGYCVRGN